MGRPVATSQRRSVRSAQADTRRSLLGMKAHATSQSDPWSRRRRSASDSRGRVRTLKVASWLLPGCWYRRGVDQGGGDGRPLQAVGELLPGEFRVSGEVMRLKPQRAGERGEHPAGGSSLD